VTAHVAPHRWADAWAGKLSDAERAELDRHAASCRKCARVRDRVTSASNSYSAIRTQQAPDLSWDTIRARVHWSVSSERRQRPRRERRTMIAWTSFAAAAAAATLLTGTLAHHASEPAIAPPIAVDTSHHATPLVGLVSRVSGDVMIDGERSIDAFARRVGPGMRLATREGRIDVQFGDASAFSLGPRSAIQLRRFDENTVELAIDGTVDVEVAPRAAGQRFLVIAGERTIEVRGTQFRVSNENGETNVACHHGLVAVRDARGAVEVPTARKVAVHRDIAGSKVEALSKDELSTLVAATPHTVPLRWSDAEAFAKNTSPLDITSDTRQDVRVDGIELGQTPVRVRVVPGRHIVEALDSAGRYRRAGWVDVGSDTPAHLDVIPVEPRPTPPRDRGAAERKQQLHTALDRARLRECVRALTKSNFDTSIQIDITVDETGAIATLNISDSELSLATQNCLKEVLQSVSFPRGPSATWQERIDL
jgi:hypothetical protein